MDTQTLHSASASEIVRNCRGTRTLREFAASLQVTYEAVRLWENGAQVADKTLQTWWDDPREWVQKLALDVLAAKFRGIAERILAEAETVAENGKAQKS